MGVLPGRGVVGARGVRRGRGAGGEARRVPRWQRGRDWPRARRERVRAPLPAARALPLPLQERRLSGSRARGSQCRLRAPARRLPFGLAALPPRRPSPGPSHRRRRRRAPWTCPGASWWPGRSACGQVRPPCLRVPVGAPRRVGAWLLGGRGSPEKRRQSSGQTPQKRAPGRLGAGSLGVRGELGKTEEARVEERGGLAAPPDTLATSGRPAGETRASRERGGRVARAGRGPGARSKRRLGSPPACGGRRLKFGEPGAAARESWGDLGAERCPESLRPRSDEAPGRGPLGRSPRGERSPAGPKATGAASQSRAPETLPDTQGRDGATGARNYAVIQ